MAKKKTDSANDVELRRDLLRSMLLQRRFEEARAVLARDNPDGRLISPDDVAAKVLWLCSPAANAVNGKAIVIAGGAA